MKLKSLSELADLLPSKAPTATDSAKEGPFASHHDGKGQSVRIRLDTKGRKGKIVTIISGLHHNPTTMKEIASTLKQYCGAGGSVKNGAIEIQGDQRIRVTEKMATMGYKVTK